MAGKYVSRGVFLLSSRMPPLRGPARRVRAAREALLDADATAALERVQVMLCDARRTQIVHALGAAPLNVTELARVIGRSKSTTSRHVRLLRENGIVDARRRGRSVYLWLSVDPLVQAALEALHLVTTAGKAQGGSSG